MDAKFEKWIRTIIATEHPQKKIIGYYFGIFESESKQYNVQKNLIKNVMIGHAIILLNRKKNIYHYPNIII
jgi:hypothetical protein